MSEPCPVCKSDKHRHHWEAVHHYRIRTDVMLGSEAVIEEPSGLEAALKDYFEKHTVPWFSEAPVRIVADITEPITFEKERTLPKDAKVGDFYRGLNEILNRYVKRYDPKADPKGGVHILENGGNGC